MKELDLLKKNWQNEDHSFNQVSDLEIYKMLHKKSSSIVKWIFIISIGELGLGVVLGLLFSFTKYDKSTDDLIKELGIYEYYIAFTVLFYLVIFYFIYRFYYMYRKISVQDNTKQLINTILKTRKTVKQYIAYNLTSFAIIFIIFGTWGFHNGYLDSVSKSGVINPEMPLGIALLSLLIIIFITSIFTFVFWIIYKLIYGILLKRLYKNYEELKKIDL